MVQGGFDSRPRHDPYHFKKKEKAMKTKDLIAKLTAEVNADATLADAEVIIKTRDGYDNYGTPWYETYEVDDVIITSLSGNIAIELGVSSY